MNIFKDSFDGKKVLVTGAGKGLGLALAKALHHLNSIVYAVSRTQSDLDGLIRECPGINTICLDLQDWDKTTEVLSEIPKIDVLINNAAILAHQAFMKITSASFDEITNINLKSVVNVSQIFAAKMIASGAGGAVVNISSMWAIKPDAGFPMYCALKSALDSLTKTMSVELGPHNIRVVSVNPGFIVTPMLTGAFKTSDKTVDESMKAFEGLKKPVFPCGKVFVPMEEVVMSVLFAASGIASMMNGSQFLVDGGYCTI